MARPGQYDFKPAGKERSDTVSVGIFQWVHKANGKDLKSGKVIYRIRGPAYKREAINNRARFLCDFWNTEGLDKLTKKSETIA